MRRLSLVLILLALITLAISGCGREAKHNAIRFQAWLTGSEENLEYILAWISVRAESKISSLEGEYSETVPYGEVDFRWKIGNLMFTEPRETFEKKNAPDWSCFVEIENRYSKPAPIQVMAQDLSRDLPRIFEERATRGQGEFSICEVYAGKWSIERPIEAVKVRAWFGTDVEPELEKCRDWMCGVAGEQMSQQLTVTNEKGEIIMGTTATETPSRYMDWLAQSPQDVGLFKMPPEEIIEATVFPVYSLKTVIVVIYKAPVSGAKAIGLLLDTILATFEQVSKGKFEGEQESPDWFIKWSVKRGDTD